MPDIFYASRSPTGTWSSAINISNQTPSFRPQIVIDKFGTLHVVWQTYIANVSYIQYATHSITGTWSTPITLGTSSGGIDDNPIHLLTTPDGAVHVAWQGYIAGTSEIQYAARSVTGTWSTSENVSSNSVEARNPRLAVDSAGNVHIIWLDQAKLRYARRSAGGLWSSPYGLSDSTAYSGRPQITVDANDAAHIVWQQVDSAGSDIFYARRTSADVWSQQNLTNSPGDWNSPQIGVDASSTIHIVWNHGYYLQRQLDGTWLGPVQTSSEDIGLPRLLVRGDGSLHVLWVRDWGFYYAFKDASGHWFAPQPVPFGYYASYYPSFDVDTAGAVYAVHSESNDVYFTELLLASQTGDSSIVQRVSLPVTLTAPTLSFLYQLRGLPSPDNGWFNVSIDDGLSTTLLLSSTDAVNPWTHHWFDLTPWAGQSITVTLNVHEVAGRPMVWAHLEEVSLGSAYPDVWVDKHGPAASSPGSSLIYTLHYDNRGGVEASGVRITDVLPSGLVFVNAAPPPITTTPNLVWDIGDLPSNSGTFTLVITAAVMPSVIPMGYYTNTVYIDATMPEAEKPNNVAEAATFIARYTYLPIMLKNPWG
jgi:uncharacterized repeat protein (TIGR01451 family)